MNTQRGCVSAARSGTSLRARAQLNEPGLVGRTNQPCPASISTSFHPLSHIRSRHRQDVIMRSVHFAGFEEFVALRMAVAYCAASAGFLLCVMSLLGIWQTRTRMNAPEKPRRVLYGVDITDTKYVDRPMCIRAATFAAKAHAGRFRKSGEPYVHHCVSTAVITEQMMLHLFSDDDWAVRRAEDCIVTALLHDALDDGDATLADLEAHAGPDVAALVSSVARLSRNNQLARRAYRKMVADGEHVRADAEIEAMKSMILQMTNEPLVIIVKLADRLHNMRTAWALQPEKAQYLAEETMRVWCPMCEYLGLSAVKAEMEDICFAVLEPQRFREVHDARERLLAGELTTKSHMSRRRRKRQVPGLESQQSATTGPVPVTPPPEGPARPSSPAAGHSPESPSDRDPSPSDRATLATPAPSMLPTPMSPVGATASADPRGDLMYGGVAVAQRPVVDVAVADLSTSFDVATGGPVAATAAAELEAAMRLTSQNAPLVEQALEPPDVPVLRVDSAACSSVDDGAVEDRENGTAEGSQQQQYQRQEADGKQIRISMADSLTCCDGCEDRDADSQGEHEEDYLNASTTAAAVRMQRDASRRFSESSAAQLEQCVHEVGMADNFRFSPGRAADALKPPAPSQTPEPPSQYSPYQRRLRELLQCVIPFRLNNFMTRHQDHRPSGALPAPMRFADDAASELMGELLVEGVGAGLTIQVQGRVKSLYSTHRKMMLKNIPIQQVYDVIALRVIVSDSAGTQAEGAIRAAYAVPPIAHRIWRRVVSEFDDYILSPKKSGYQSIHLAAIGPGGVPLEVQVRTSSMHYQAEYGAASHWAYKDRMRASLAAQATEQHAASVKAPPPSPSPAMHAFTDTAATPQDSDSEPPAAGNGKEADGVRPVEPGQPVFCVDEGSLCDGVVLSSDPSSGFITVAISNKQRWKAPDDLSDASDCEGAADTAPVVAASRLLASRDYQEMWAYARDRCLELPGHRDQRLEVQEFRLYREGKYVKVDRFGQMYQFCTLVFVQPSDCGGVSSSSAQEVPEGSRQSGPRPAATLCDAPADTCSTRSPFASSQHINRASEAPGVSAVDCTALGDSSERGSEAVRSGDTVAQGSQELLFQESDGAKSSDGAGNAQAAAKMEFQGDCDGRLGRWQRFGSGRRKGMKAIGTAAVPVVDEERVLQLRAQLEWGDSPGMVGVGRGRKVGLRESRRELYELSRAGDLLTRTGLDGGRPSGGPTRAPVGGDGSFSQVTKPVEHGGGRAEQVQLLHSEERVPGAGGDSSRAQDTPAEAGRGFADVENVPYSTNGSSGGGEFEAEGGSATPVGGAGLGKEPIQVYIYPLGVTYVPQGATAGDVVARFGRIEISGDDAIGERAVRAAREVVQARHEDGINGSGHKLVNVNNELVKEDTRLVPGDLVVLSGQVLSNV